jgi:hypothetical protein
MRFGLTCLIAWACVSAAGGTARAADPLPLALVLRSDSPELSFGRLRESLELALGADVVPGAADGGNPTEVRGTVTVTWRPTRRELAVTYQDVRRGTVSRVVPAPDDPDQALTSATELAANLVRDEAAELLGETSAPPAPAPVAVLIAPPSPPEPPRPRQPVVASLFYPLATNYAAPDVHTRLSLNGLYGRVGQLDGLQLGLVTNAVDGPVAGAQVGLGINLAGGEVDGIQVAAFGFNYADRAVDGMQAALGLNRSAGGRGLQLSFAINRTAGPFAGLQAAAVNVAEDMRGMQLGLVNVAGRVRGVQLGLINIADDVEGIPIGLISVTRTGGVHPLFWAASDSFAALALKFSTRYTYTLFSGAARREQERNLFGPGLALGVRVPFLPVYFESDLGAHFLFGGPLCCVSARVGLADDLLVARWRALLGWQFHHRFSLFVGAAVAALGRFHEPTDARTIEVAPELFGGVQL